MLTKKRNNYLSQFSEKEKKVILAQERRKKELQDIHYQDVVKKFDRKETVERINKIQEYQRQKLSEKIEKDNEKAENIRIEREAILENRKKIKNEIEKNKQEMMQKFEKVKQGKADPDVVMKSFVKENKNTENSLFEAKKSESVEKSKPTPPPKKETKKETKKQPVNQTAKSPPKTQTYKKEDNNAKKLIENLKAKQNQEMLLILEEEQKKEDEREKREEAATNEEEKKKLETMFGIERAKAQVRIQELSKKHDNELEYMMKKLGVK